MVWVLRKHVAPCRANFLVHFLRVLQDGLATVTNDSYYQNLQSYILLYTMTCANDRFSQSARSLEANGPKNVLCCHDIHLFFRFQARLRYSKSSRTYAQGRGAPFSSHSVPLSLPTGHGLECLIVGTCHNVEDAHEV